VTVAQDEVAAATDSYRIRTTAREGDVASASIRLRATDLRPLEERLEFRDAEWVEFTDITETTAGAGSNPVVTEVEPPVRTVVPSRPAALSGPASISDELRVFSALHEIGADLGDPVEVGISNGRVLVSGVGISPERQRQIHGLLDGTPNVTIR